MRAPPVLFAALAWSAAFAQNSTSVKQYKLSGSGTLYPDKSTLAEGTLTLRATLQSKDGAIATQPLVQEGGRFALMAKAMAASSVCYNDTIFRDDFDGDGR
jgi:hypothetical protein